MKEIALLFKTPAVVFKYDRSFNNYSVVDIAYYGVVGLNQNIVYLLHTDDNKFDWLELDENVNRRVHSMYERIYNSQFQEPSEYQRQVAAVDGQQEEEEGSSVNSYISNNGESVSGYSEDSDEEILPYAAAVAAHEASDAAEVAAAASVVVVAAAAAAATTTSGAADGNHDGDSLNNSTTCSGSSSMSPKDGYEYCSSIPNVLTRDNKFADGQCLYTNKVTGELKYQVLDPVVVKGFPSNVCRFVFMGDIWMKNSRTPKHLVYDINNGTLHHVMPSHILSRFDEGDNVDEYIYALRNGMENKLTEVFSFMKRRKLFPKLSALSKDQHIPKKKSKEPVFEETVPADDSDEPTEIPVTIPCRARGREY